MATMLAFSSMPINAYAEYGQEANIESQEDEKEQNDTVSCDAIVEPTEETDTTESVSNDSYRNYH